MRVWVIFCESVQKKLNSESSVPIAGCCGYNVGVWCFKRDFSPGINYILRFRLHFQNKDLGEFFQDIGPPRFWWSRWGFLCSRFWREFFLDQTKTFRSSGFFINRPPRTFCTFFIKDQDQPQDHFLDQDLDFSTIFLIFASAFFKINPHSTPSKSSKPTSRYFDQKRAQPLTFYSKSQKIKLTSSSELNPLTFPLTPPLHPSNKLYNNKYNMYL